VRLTPSSPWGLLAMRSFQPSPADKSDLTSCLDFYNDGQLVRAPLLGLDLPAKHSTWPLCAAQTIRKLPKLRRRRTSGLSEFFPAGTEWQPPEAQTGQYVPGFITHTCVGCGEYNSGEHMATYNELPT
jgi:hypothetical protein